MSQATHERAFEFRPPHPISRESGAEMVERLLEHDTEPEVRGGDFCFTEEVRQQLAYIAAGLR